MIEKSGLMNFLLSSIFGRNYTRLVVDFLFSFFLPILFFQCDLHIVHVGKFLHWSNLNVYGILENDGNNSKRSRSAHEAVIIYSILVMYYVILYACYYILLTPCLLSSLSIKSMTAIKVEIFQRNPSTKEKQFISWNWLIYIL